MTSTNTRITVTRIVLEVDRVRRSLVIDEGCLSTRGSTSDGVTDCNRTAYSTNCSVKFVTKQSQGSWSLSSRESRCDNTVVTVRVVTTNTTNSRTTTRVVTPATVVCEGGDNLSTSVIIENESSTITQNVREGVEDHRAESRIMDVTVDQDTNTSTTLSTISWRITERSTVLNVRRLVQNWRVGVVCEVDTTSSRTNTSSNSGVLQLIWVIGIIIESNHTINVQTLNRCCVRQLEHDLTVVRSDTVSRQTFSGSNLRRSQRRTNNRGEWRNNKWKLLNEFRRRQSDNSRRQVQNLSTLYISVSDCRYTSVNGECIIINNVNNVEVRCKNVSWEEGGVNTNKQCTTRDVYVLNGGDTNREFNLLRTVDCTYCEVESFRSCSIREDGCCDTRTTWAGEFKVIKSNQVSNIETSHCCTNSTGCNTSGSVILECVNRISITTREARELNVSQSNGNIWIKNTVVWCCNCGQTSYFIIDEVCNICNRACVITCCLQRSERHVWGATIEGILTQFGVNVINSSGITDGHPSRNVICSNTQ